MLARFLGLLIVIMCVLALVGSGFFWVFAIAAALLWIHVVYRRDEAIDAPSEYLDPQTEMPASPPKSVPLRASLPFRSDADPSEVVKVLIVDVETTGLSARDELVEISMVMYSVHKPSGALVAELSRYCGLRQPSFPIPPAAIRVHGITDDEVRGKNIDLDAIDRLFVNCDCVVAHNCSFDKRFVKSVVPVMRRKTWLCSCRGIDWRSRGFANGKLQDLARSHRIEIDRAHRADSDVETVLRLLCQQDPVSGMPYMVGLLNEVEPTTPRRVSNRKASARAGV